MAGEHSVVGRIAVGLGAGAAAGRPLNGTWEPGDPPGRRQFAALFTGPPLALHAGASIGPVTVAYETWGAPSPDQDNAVLVEHALTGDSHAAGAVEAGHPTPGWWSALVGPGLAIDTDRWWVVCPNVLGGCQGTTGPASPGADGRRYGPLFPPITVRDQVDVEAALADHLGIGRWAAVVGGSMGGMRVLEWAAGRPERVARAVVLACGAAASGEQIALCALQAHAIRCDPEWWGGDYYDRPGEGPVAGLGLARRIGHVSYRSEGELAARFGRRPQAGEDPWRGGRYEVESYLDHQAAKLVRRFDANSYLVLSRAMDHHDVGRGRGGVAAALAQVTADTTVIGIDSDRLYPPYLQQEIADLLPGRPPLQVVHSAIGHDGFLVESGQIGPIVRAAMSRPETRPRPGGGPNGAGRRAPAVGAGPGAG